MWLKSEDWRHRRPPSPPLQAVRIRKSVESEPMKWSEFISAAPTIGPLAQEAFDQQHLAILGTLRRDGWPRISPCEVYFVDGELLLGMMPMSSKVRDLRRVSIITVVNGQEHREPRLGDVKLYGRATEIVDVAVKGHYADAQEA